MRIEKLGIKKFRSVEKTYLEVQDINAIVGQNNSGKSSFLRALNSFFNFDEEKNNFIDGSHTYLPRSKPKIEISFTSIPADPELRSFIYKGKIIVEITFHPGQAKRTIKYKTNGGFSVTDEAIITIIKKHINFIFIPPNRDGKQLVETETNVLKLLLEAYLDDATKNKDNYSKKFQNAAKFLEDNALKRIAQLSKNEYTLKNKFDFEIKFKDTINYKDFLAKIHISLSESGITQPLSECGTGIQSLTIIALFILLGKLKNENVLIGLEEPETNLHPQAQRELINTLKGLVDEKKILQIFFTTHSNILIDEINHSQVILYRKGHDSQRGFKSFINQVPSDFFEKYNLDEFQYYQFHHYRNSDFFYSNFIVVVESKNEIEIIKLLSQKANLNLDLAGITFINLSGVDNIRYPIYLLEELKIPYLMVVDKDFFTPYLNDRLKDSRNVHGYPLYRNEFKNLDVIKKIIKSETKRNELLLALRGGNHTNISNILKNYNIISMRFTLDIDLAVTSKGSDKYYEILSIPQTEQTVKILLENKVKAIKKIKNLITVTSTLELSSLPYTYRRLRKYLIEKAAELNKV